MTLMYVIIERYAMYSLPFIQIYSGMARGGVLNGESYTQRTQKLFYHMIQICCGITSGRVLNGELYAQRLYIKCYNITYCM